MRAHKDFQPGPRSVPTETHKKQERIIEPVQSPDLQAEQSLLTRARRLHAPTRVINVWHPFLATSKPKDELQRIVQACQRRLEASLRHRPGHSLLETL
jgi:hypothetical protein